MQTRKNEFKTSLDKTKYNEVRRNAIRAMGFCPECSNFLPEYFKARCNDCSTKGKMRKLNAQ